jgi:CheY-like chemotaxis protein
MKERILVVDDEPAAADGLVRLLITLGYDARAAYDGRQGIEYAAEFLPDMVFLDIGMPGFDGYQTISRLRGHRECAHAILIALTGWTKREDRQHAYERGFDLHVAKPMSIQTLHELLALLDPRRTDSTATKINRLESALNPEPKATLRAG